MVKALNIQAGAGFCVGVIIFQMGKFPGVIVELYSKTMFSLVTKCQFVF